MQTNYTAGGGRRGGLIFVLFAMKLILATYGFHLCEVQTYLRREIAPIIFP